MKTTKHTPDTAPAQAGCLLATRLATDGRFIVEEVEGRSFWKGQPFIADCGISASHRPAGITKLYAETLVARYNATPGATCPTTNGADLDRWEALQADRRALLGALRELVYRNQIMLNYETQGRTETRWTEKDGIAQPGAKANHDALLPALAQARAAIERAEKGQP